MPAHNRNDEPVTSKRDEWLPIVRQAAERRSTRGLPKPPPGIDARQGAYYTTTRDDRNDGTARIWLKWYEPKRRTTLLGSYLISGIPVGRIMTLDSGRKVKIFEDRPGLAYPVPLEIAR